VGGLLRRSGSCRGRKERLSDGVRFLCRVRQCGWSYCAYSITPRPHTRRVGQPPWIKFFEISPSAPRRRARGRGGGVAGAGGARGSGRGRAVERGRWSGGDRPVARQGRRRGPRPRAPASLSQKLSSKRKPYGRRLATLHVARGPFICDARSAPSPPRAPTPWYLVALSSYKVCMWDSGNTQTYGNLNYKIDTGLSLI